MLHDEERELIARCSTPERAQEFLDSLSYNWEADGVSTLRSLRRVARDRTAHCLEGAVAAAALLSHHGHRRWMFYLDALDICHATCLYYRRDASGARRYGAVAMSRDPNLKFRPPEYATLRDLAMSYYPHYYNYYTGDRSDLTLRGYAVIDLARYGEDIVTSEEDLLRIEDRVWDVTYRGLFPPPDGRRRYRLLGRTTEIEWL